MAQSNNARFSLSHLVGLMEQLKLFFLSPLDMATKDYNMVADSLADGKRCNF